MKTCTNKTKLFFSEKIAPKSVMGNGVGVCEARFGIRHPAFLLHRDAKDILEKF